MPFFLELSQSAAIGSSSRSVQRRISRFPVQYCDEYWIVLEGTGVAVSEGKHYAVGPGDCLATGMGHHHDFPTASAPVHAVYFETTLGGERRRGHLWNHTHGPAQPRLDRV